MANPNQLLDRRGGVAALSGFLFQFVAIIGFVAEAAALPADVGDDDADLLLKAIRAQGLVPELADADAASLGIEPDDQTILVQVKYSGANPPTKIYPKELQEICRGFANQIRAIQEQENRLVDRLILVTNRSLSTDADRKLRRANNGAAVGPKGWPPEMWRVLGGITLRPRQGLNDWTGPMEQLGLLLGATREESASAASHLVGQLINAVGRGNRVRITHSTVAAAITGASGARVLDETNVSLAALENLAEFRQRAGVGAGPQFVARDELLDQIDRAGTSAALIVVTGKGGGGKSVAAAQWLDQRLKDRGARRNAFGAIVRADDMAPDWLRVVLRKWANATQGPPDRWPQRNFQVGDLGSRIAGATAANDVHHCPEDSEIEQVWSERGPHFVLIIDGIDEAPANRPEALTDLLRWFREEHERANQTGQPARALLVVTCRSQGELRDLRGGAIAGLGNPEPYREIRTDSFSVGELVQVARGVDAAIASRLRRHFNNMDPGLPAVQRPDGIGALGRRIPRRPGFVGDQELLGDDVGVAAPSPVIADSLRHPAMWGAFAAIQPDQRESALDGEAAGTLALSEEFFKWAIGKCRLRHPVARNHAQGLMNHLIRVGERANGQRPDRSFPFADWYDQPTGHPLDPSIFARHLDSSGVIEIDDADNRWTWVHPFVSKVFENDESKRQLRAWAQRA